MKMEPNSLTIKEHNTYNNSSLNLSENIKYNLKLTLGYQGKYIRKDEDFFRTEILEITNIDGDVSVEFENCKFKNLKSLIFETKDRFKDDSRNFPITFKNCELKEEILIENKTKKLVSVIFENNKEETPVVTIGKNKIDNDGKKENLIQFEFMNFSIINSTIDAKMIKIVNNSKSFNFKKCIFNSDVDITIQNCSINKFENCEFNGENTKLSIQNIQRTEPNSFKKCEFNNSILTINGIQTNPLHLEIEDGKFNVNKIDINQININFKNVEEFTRAKFYIEKNEDIKHQYGSAKIPSNLSFFGGAYKEFELRDYGNNSFKFENCNNINYLSFKNGAQALELFNCIIKKFTINGEITEKAIFNNVTFENPPEIGDIKFKNCNVEFRDIKFIDKKSPEAIAGFRALNKACRDANYHHGEIFFHGLTLEGIGKNLKYKSDFVEKLFSFFYKYFSDFGRSVNRPLCWLVGIFFFFIVINFVGITINKINDLKLSQQSLINKLTVENNQILTKINDIKDIQTENKEICEEKSLLINYLKSQQQSVSNKSIVENNKNCEEELQIVKINSKIVFKNAFGPLQLALPKDFISDCESKFYNQNSNLIIYFLNFVHAVISSGIWFIWFFMIRARFKL